MRGIDDYKNDLRSYLELWWYLVPLENRPVSPLYLQMDAEVSAVLAQRLERPQELTIGLASPFANLDFSIHSDPERLHHRDGTPYRFVGLATDPEQMRASRAALARIAASCKTHRVDILCFPELTLDTDSLRELAHLLAADNCDDQPVLVIAGSFHLPGDHGWMNRCTVLDGCGRKLFEQNKSVAFRIPPQRAQALGAAGRALLGIDERGGYEDIDVGTELVIVDSPLGRMVTPICLDFCGDELIDLVTASCVNFFLVPAMTERMKNFHQQAVHLGTRTGAASFVANSVWLLKRLAKSDAAIDNELSVMGYLPRRGGLFTRAQRAADCEDLRLFTMRVLLGMTG